MTESLFDAGPPVEQKKLSTDARRTIRNRRMLDGGTHPVTRLRLASFGDPGNGHTCGDCAHHGLQGGVAGRFHKCGAQNGRYLTGGPASDIRVSWPACVLWEAT